MKGREFITSFIILYITALPLIGQEIWVEKTHLDFTDGWEYFYLAGDTATQWDEAQLRRWELGGYLYAPVLGGIRIIGRDWDLNDDGFLDVVLDWFANYSARIYWNSSNGFNTSNYTQLSGFSANPQGISLVDLNTDGYQDILVASYEPGRGSIFYGSVNGYSSIPDDSIKYAPPYTQDMQTCDINGDGYLDILASGGTIVNIYPGPPPFANTDPISTLNCPAGIASGINVADLNNDGFLDISVSHNQNGTIRIFWGPNFSSYQDLPAHPNYDHSIADFNGDGYLDIVFAQNSDSSCIYWGSSSGYSVGNCTLLPGSGKGDIDCEDINNDGAIDIALSHRYDGSCSVWWGPQFQSRVQLPVVDGPMVVNVVDWNDDGYRDLLAGGIYGPTYLYWNSSIGFDPTRKFTFPDNCDDGVWEDLGNLWDRSNRERYLSSIFDAGDTITVDSVKWWGNFPSGVVCSLWVRGALDTMDWGQWVLLSNGGTDTVLAEKRFLQYRCTFLTDYKRTSEFSFDSIKVYYHSGPIVKLILEPNYADSTLPQVPVSYDLRVINIGIGLDTVDLRYEHNTNWQISLFDSTGTNLLIDHNNNSFPDVIININDTVPIVLTVTPPSGAQGGEIDSLRLIGNSNINPLLVDTAYITTRIRRVAGILIDPDQVGYTIAGVPKSYDLWIYNQGTNQDTVDLFYHHPKPWGIALLDSTGTMPLADHNNNNHPDLWVSSSDSVKFKLVVYSPDTASAGVADTLILTGRSSLNPAITDSARIITVIEGMGSIIIFPDQQATGLPGNWSNFLITARNNQNFIDTIDLRYIDRLGFSYQFLDSLNNPLIDHNNNSLVDLPGIGPSGAEIDFNVRVLIPSNASAGIRDTILIFGYSGRDTTIRDSSINILTVGTVAQVRLEPERSDSGSCGDSIDYLLWSENLGNAGDVIDLALIDTSFHYSLRALNGNPLIDTDGDGLPDLGLLNAFGGCESLLVRVKIPQVNQGVIDTVVVRAYSSNNSAIYDDAILRTKSLGGIWGLRIDPDQQSRVEVGKSVSYQLQAVLQANLSDVVNIKSSGVISGWGVEILNPSNNSLVDNNGDGLIDLDTVIPNIPEGFIVRVSAPQDFDFTGLLDTLVYFDLVVYGECSMRSEIRDSAFLRTILVPPFGVHNFRNPFKERTQFIFSLPKSGRVSLQVFTRAGELVRKLITNRHYDFGIHYYPWDGKNDAGQQLAPGVYIYVFDFIGDDGEHLTSKKKAVIIK